MSLDTSSSIQHLFSVGTYGDLVIMVKEEDEQHTRTSLSGTPVQLQQALLNEIRVLM